MGALPQDGAGVQMCEHLPVRTWLTVMFLVLGLAMRFAVAYPASDPACCADACAMADCGTHASCPPCDLLAPGPAAEPARHLPAVGFAQVQVRGQPTHPRFDIWRPPPDGAPS